MHLHLYNGSVRSKSIGCMITHTYSITSVIQKQLEILSIKYDRVDQAVTVAS
jgi:hypothetical protein